MVLKLKGSRKTYKFGRRQNIKNKIRASKRRKVKNQWIYNKNGGGESYREGKK